MVTSPMECTVCDHNWSQRDGDREVFSKNDVFMIDEYKNY